MSVGDSEIGPLDIVCLHVGGSGDPGPIDAIVRSPFSKHAIVVLFEAHGQGLEAFSPADIQKRYEKAGVRTIRAPIAVGGRVETETTTIAQYIADHPRLAPDVLSIHARGTEAAILGGAGSEILREAAGVISEAAFREAYAGQGLFCDQMATLRDCGFQLADITNQQYQHTGPAVGEGFLTVGEALFLREIASLRESYQSDRYFYRTVKAAAIAYCFRRFAHSHAILQSLADRDEPKLRETLGKAPAYERLLEDFDFIRETLPQYRENSRMFLESDRFAGRVTQEKPRSGVLDFLGVSALASLCYLAIRLMS